MAYKSTRRQWVKLWVNEWLDGTTRFELTAAQRLLWVDLLALAGRSRFPGFIYAGTGQGSERVGYPIAYLAGVLQMDEIDTNNALKLLAAHGHITLEEVSPEKYIIGIVNWEKYQSEYLRQKGYRKVTTQTTSRLPVEGEVDVEGEKRQRKSQDTAAAFLAIGHPAPFGQKQFQKEWVSYFMNGTAPYLNLKMEDCIQRCQDRGIKVPPQFYDAKRDVEAQDNARVRKRVPL